MHGMGTPNTHALPSFAELADRLIAHSTSLLAAEPDSTATALVVMHRLRDDLIARGAAAADLTRLDAYIALLG